LSELPDNRPKQETLYGTWEALKDLKID